MPAYASVMAIPVRQTSPCIYLPQLGCIVPLPAHKISGMLVCRDALQMLYVDLSFALLSGCMYGASR